nr:hypothetical protein [Tanacetum cinerariifolium]
MRDENPIRTLGDYSKPSHEGHRNTIELLVGNNMVPLRSDTIRERTRLRLFRFPIRDQASNLLKRLPAGSITTWDDLMTRFLAQFFPSGRTAKLLPMQRPITTWKDLTTRFLAQFFPPRRTVKLCNDIQMFQRHHGESLSEAWTRFKDLLQKVPVRDDQQNRHSVEGHHRSNSGSTSDTVKNPKLSTTPVLSDRSYPTTDPQCSSHPFTSINYIKAHFKETTISQKSLWRPEIKIKPQQPEEPEPTLKDEFQDLHVNLPVLEVLAHASISNSILDKYVESLELGKNESAFVQGSCVNIIPLYLFKKLNIRLLEKTDHIFRLADKTKSLPIGIVKDVEVHIGKLKLLNDFYVIDMKDPETLLLVGKGFLAIVNAIIDCRMAKITVGERITRSVFRVKRVDLGEEEATHQTTLGKRVSYKPRPCSDGIVARDDELNPFKDTLVFRRMVEFLGAISINLKSNMWESEDLIKKPINWDKPSKNGDGAWHAKIRLIDPDGEEFTKTPQSIPTTSKLSKRENLMEIIDLDHFYDRLYLMRRSLEVLRKFHWTVLG